MKRTTLPTIVIGRRMYGTSVEENPKITFELEAETGELFEVSFSLRGIVSTVTMALNWLPLKEGLLTSSRRSIFEASLWDQTVT